jgi:cell division transport system permease protein
MTVRTERIGDMDRRLLPEGRLAGPMPWVIAIMMFLTVLAAATGLSLGNAARSLGADIGNRITIQIVEANPDFREAQARITVATLRKLAGVQAIRRIEASELERLLKPWLGAGGLETDLPVPVMIDADLSPEAYRRLDLIRAAVRDAAPSARIDDNAQWLAPLAKLINALRWLATALVLLMIGATAATVVLAARAALDTHRGTIEVLHLMGATDVQVARLFQRRIALDALFGGVVGLGVGAVVLIMIGQRVGALGSELLGSAGLPLVNWLILAALPIGGVVLATLVARLTILRALGRML